MTRITEDHLENYVINELVEQGYQYVYGPDIAVDGSSPERASYQEVILVERLRNAVKKLNPKVPAEAQEIAVRDIVRLIGTDLLTINPMT